MLCSFIHFLNLFIFLLSHLNPHFELMNALIQRIFILKINVMISLKVKSSRQNLIFGMVIKTEFLDVK